MGRRPIEDIVDEALQSLTEGETAQAILTSYPGYEEELRPLLFAAGTLKDTPQPQLSQSTIAAMVERAQIQASSDRRALPAILPPVERAADVEADELERTPSPRRATRVATPSRPGWNERIASWLRPSNPLSKVPAVLALLLVVAAGLFAISRLTSQTPPPFMPVPPLVANQFSLDGTVQQIGTGAWIVDGTTVYLDAGTVVNGVPSVGSRAHIEGDISQNNRRVARMITIGNTMSVTETVVSQSSPPSWPTVAEMTGQTTVSTATIEVTSTAPPAGTPARPSATRSSPGSTATTLPSLPARTAQVTESKQPATAGPTRVATSQPTAPGTNPPATPARPNVLPTDTSRPLPTTTALPVQTNTPRTENTPTSAPEPSATREPEPNPTIVAPPTSEPTNTPGQTPTERPTIEPTFEPTLTAEPELTAEPSATEPPEPHDTETPRPTSAPLDTPTTQPTVPVQASPTRSEEPHETQTAEPTHGPQATNTAQPAGTPQPSRTAQPGQTAQPTRTREPEDTHTPQETHAPQPSEEPRDTETAQPTHQAAP